MGLRVARGDKKVKEEMMSLGGIGSEGVVLLSLYLLIKDVVAPLVKKLNGKNNISIAKFYQEFKSFKEDLFPAFQKETKERCEKRGTWIKELDDKVDNIRINRGRRKK